jgi:hypothetical protein
LFKTYQLQSTTLCYIYIKKMTAQKTKVKAYRIKISTLDAIDELCRKVERKHNWYVQKILDNYLENLKKTQHDSR